MNKVKDFASNAFKVSIIILVVISLIILGSTLGIAVLGAIFGILFSLSV